jgi:hypothetical protein
MQPNLPRMPASYPLDFSGNLGKIAHMALPQCKHRTPVPIGANAPPPNLRPIAIAPQWSLTEYVCSAGPHDRTFETT